MSSTSEENPRRPEIDRFILDEIDSVPHLEALLLVWNNRPKPLPVADLAALLFLPQDHTRQILEHLQQRALVALAPTGCSYNPDSRYDLLLEEVDRTWRRELVRISNMIHSKASPAVREFARAFRFKKDPP
jgi:DNA-binding IclR family transcriptional regulator